MRPFERQLFEMEAEVTGEPLMQATTEYLNVPPRDKRDAALDRAESALTEARLQIEYLHHRLGQTTGSGNSVVARIAAALAMISEARAR